MMLLQGSCSCGAVQFRFRSRHPVPYMRCYCSICRKTAGGGGFCINIGGDYQTLKVDGESCISTYRATVERKGEKAKSKHARSFCKICGTHLWARHQDWPDLLHPVAGVIDSELPKPTEIVHMMCGSRRNWVEVGGSTSDARFDAYPEKSIAEFHDDRGWTEK